MRNICPRCGGTMNFQASTYTLNRSRHGMLYWLVIGWWLHPLLWIFLTLPMLLWRVIAPNRREKVRTKTVGVCQKCGYTRRR